MRSTRWSPSVTVAAIIEDGVADPALRRYLLVEEHTLWMTAAELRGCVGRHRSPLVLRCIEDHLADRRHPLDLVTTDASVRVPELKS